MEEKVEITSADRDRIIKVLIEAVRFHQMVEEYAQAHYSDESENLVYFRLIRKKMEACATYLMFVDLPVEQPPKPSFWAWLIGRRSSKQRS